MVTKRKRIVLAGVSVAVFTALVWHFSRPSEPAHDGRTLTEWMSALGSSDSDEEAHAFAAIEAIGTNGLPTITRFLAKTDSSSKLRCLALLDRVPFLRLRVTTAAEWRQKAKVALILSGAESQHASIPTLDSLSRHSNPAVRLTAVDALSKFMFTEPACLPPLEAAQSDVDVKVRATAQEAVQRLRGVSNAVERLREMRPKQLHTNPARASRFHSGRPWRRVGELKRSAVTFAYVWPFPHLLPHIFYRPPGIGAAPTEGIRSVRNDLKNAVGTKKDVR